MVTMTSLAAAAAFVALCTAVTLFHVADALPFQLSEHRRSGDESLQQESRDEQLLNEIMRIVRSRDAIAKVEASKRRMSEPDRDMFNMGFIDDDPLLTLMVPPKKGKGQWKEDRQVKRGQASSSLADSDYD